MFSLSIRTRKLSFAANFLMFCELKQYETFFLLTPSLCLQNFANADGCIDEAAA
jgi:hypothetical protein